MSHDNKAKIHKSKFYTFDIETTTITTGLDDDKNPIRNGIIWSGQFYDGVKYTQVRDLFQTIDFLKKLEVEAIENYKGEKLLVVVHNLSYEYQFIKSFFVWTNIIATNNRKIISAETEGLIFRCSYMLSNQSLSKFLKNEGVPEKYQKTSMDYLVKRFPWTPLTEEEKEYCANDVIGLHLAMQKRINDCFHKDVNNLPLTSTGYVRKACRDAWQKNKKNKYRFWKEALDLDTFNMLHTAFRGGNTHANRYYVNKPIVSYEYAAEKPQLNEDLLAPLLVKDIGQKDEISAYPAALLLYDYPTKFYDLKPYTQHEFDYYFNRPDKWAILLEVIWTDIELKNPEATPVPYISASKCDKLAFHSAIREEKALEVDNGRILSAACLSTICTEIDYRIISKQYQWKEEKIIRVKVARKKPIPAELKEQILNFYMKKTSLKQDEASPDYDPDIAYNYSKAKNMINGIYGMHVTNPIKHDYLINNTNEYLTLDDGTEVAPHCLYLDNSKSDEEILDAYYKNYSSFLSYQVGIWVTSYARMMLEEGIDACYNPITKRNDLIYCDTDSCKYINKEQHQAAFDAINAKRKALCEERGSYIDYQGKRWYLGLYDDEPDALAFKTFGAKKYMYAYKIGDKIDYKITISGVPKAAGKWCIDEAINNGKIKSFLEVSKGFIFHGIKTTSCYMELDCLNCYDVEDGKKVYYSSNIAMYPNSYTLGLTYDFEILLEKFKDYM